MFPRKSDKNATKILRNVLKESIDKRDYLFFHQLGDSFFHCPNGHRDLFYYLNKMKTNNNKSFSFTKSISFTKFTNYGITIITVITFLFCTILGFVAFDIAGPANI